MIIGCLISRRSPSIRFPAHDCAVRQPACRLDVSTLHLGQIHLIGINKLVIDFLVKRRK